jgi:hypothetical protein
LTTPQWPTGHRIAVIGNGRSFTISVDGEYFTISDSNPKFEQAKTALKEKNLDNLLAALKPISIVQKAAGALGKVRLEGDKVYAGERELRGVIIDRILEFKREGWDFKHLLNFLERLHSNPSKTAVDELYLFLESSKTPLPITENGTFLAYKKVRTDFKDLHSGKLDYSVGRVVEMPRNEVDDNRNRTCSHGLHFCSLDYLPQFHGGSGIVVEVEIDPADVVSIPSDYRNTKGRTAKMKVLRVHSGGERVAAWDKGFVRVNPEPVKIAPAPVLKAAPAPQKPLPTGQTNKSSNWTYFSSREAARNYANATGRKFKDFGWNSNTGYRWAVAN